MRLRLQLIIDNGNSYWQWVKSIGPVLYRSQSFYSEEEAKDARKNHLIKWFDTYVGN